MSKKPKTALAKWPDGVLMIDVAAVGVEFLVLVIDGIPMKQERGPRGKIGRTYMTVKDALAWHQREWDGWKRPNSDKAIEALTKILAKDAAGEIQYNDEATEGKDR